jgi:hypothetical protein
VSDNIPKNVSAYLSRIGEKGGKVKSEAKKKAAEQRQNSKKMTACPHPAYRRKDGRDGSHHFSPDNVCYGCKIKRKDALI